MKSDTFTYDDEFLVFNHGEKVGEIPFRLHYTVTSWGRPEQPPTYDSGGEPAEGAEIEGGAVLMQAGKTEASYIPAWPWLEEWVNLWALTNIDELVKDAGEYLEGRQEADAEARAEARDEVQR